MAVNAVVSPLSCKITDSMGKVHFNFPFYGIDKMCTEF